MDTSTDALPGYRADHGASFAPGALVGGRYRIVGRIGAGGMATIHRAVDQVLGRHVAVKVLHPHLTDDEELLARFRSEARAVAGLLHPNVVAVFDQGTEPGPYIVLEHVDGLSLRALLSARGRLDPGEAVSVVDAVCAGLARAHAAGLVHRDVKPENVMVGGDGVVKVTDFGIARALAGTAVTRTGTLMGSVHYLAPELVDGREATPASDQYAVGVLLYELLTGRKPLPADSPMAVALRHTREDIPPPSRVAPDVPAALDRAVARATARRPERRFADLDGFAAAVRAAAAPAAVSLPAPAAESGSTPTTVLNPDDAAAGGTPIPTLLVPSAERDTTSLASAADVRRRRPRHRVPRAVRRALVAALSLLLLGVAAVGAWGVVVAPPRGVPRLVGLDEPAAREAAAALDLLLEVEPGREHDLGTPAGAVLRQEPAPGATTRRGRSIAVVLSAGPATVEMPTVAGLEEAEALAVLRGTGYAFRVRVDRDWAAEDEPEGVVQAQLPEPGQPVEQGAEVVINVSRGIEQVQVPDLRSGDAEAAEAALEDARLQVQVIEEFSDAEPTPGAVLRQLPAHGAEVDVGSTVRVVVSRGALTLTVPDVLGEPVEQARTKLIRLGFDVEVVSEPRPRLGPFPTGRIGHVEVQDPGPGARLRRGSRVDLYTFSD